MDDPKPQPTNQPVDQPDPSTVSNPRTYDNEPETYVNATGKPVSLTTAQQQSQLAPVKKSSGAKKWLLGGLVFLLVTGLGALTYWLWSEGENTKKELSSVQTELTALKDATRKDPVAERDEKVAQELTDEEASAEEAINYIDTRSDRGVEEPVLQNRKITSDYAMYTWTNGPSPGQTSGLNIFLKKVNDSWVVVASSFEGLSEEEYKLYNIPTN